MTNRTVPETDTIEAMRHAQSSAIIAILDDWLRAAPDREICISYDALTGVRVALRDERTSRGESLQDAAAQVCTVLMVDRGEVTP
jgi:hypothetical protein